MGFHLKKVHVLSLEESALGLAQMEEVQSAHQKDFLALAKRCRPCWEEPFAQSVLVGACRSQSQLAWEVVKGQSCFLQSEW